MTRKYDIIIAGAGGIARAAGLMLMEICEVTPNLYIGNRRLSAAREMASWIKEGVEKDLQIECFELTNDSFPAEVLDIFKRGDILLDCLPGSVAPKMASLAKDHDLHYANLTEYVAETEEIIEMAHKANTGFLLQTGLAPGYIDVLGNHLFKEFCRKYGVQQVDSLKLKVGALTRNAVAPHFYGFTWSPVGVATEYLKKAEVIRDYKKILWPSLSERAEIIIDGITYEEDLTSGGAADLPENLSGRVRSLDYKTLRFPGHYSWIEEQVASLEGRPGSIALLQENMEKAIPHIEDDQVILYAAVEGMDDQDIRRRMEVLKKILPQKVGKHRLRAIQITTAAPLLQSAMYLLNNLPKGVVLQSQIKTEEFLNGRFITSVFGPLNL